MPTPNATQSGHFSLGGDLKVNRLGFLAPCASAKASGPAG